MFVVCVCSCMCMGGKGTKVMHVKSITCNAARNVCVYISLSVVFACVHHESLAMPLSRRLYFKYISIYIYLFLLYFQNTIIHGSFKGRGQGRGRPLHRLRVTPLGRRSGREAGPPVATGNTSLQDVMSANGRGHLRG